MVATTNCTNPKNLKNIFSPFALIKYHTGKASNLCRIFSRTRGISQTWHCAGRVSWNFSLGVGLASFIWFPPPSDTAPAHLVTLNKTHSTVTRRRCSSGPLVSPSHFWEFRGTQQPAILAVKEIQSSGPEAAAAFLKLRFIWARGEHFPPETLAGRV